MSFNEIIVPIVSGLIGASGGAYAARLKKQTDTLTVTAGKDEVVLVHYDKIVDQLQEEVRTLRTENENLRKTNMQLERDVLSLNRQVFELARELTNLKNWMAQHLEN